MTKKNNTLYSRVRQILESARVTAARSVNSAQVVANWLVGREIVEEEQNGKKRADYGKALLQSLSKRLTRDFDRGWSVRQLEYTRSFYLEYTRLLHSVKSNAARSISGEAEITNAVRNDAFAFASADWSNALLRDAWTKVLNARFVAKGSAA